jgi:hypothetical protein
VKKASSIALTVAALAITSAPALAEPEQMGPTSAPQSSKESPRALLRQAIDLYVVGRYTEAAARLRPLVESRVLTDMADQKEALRTYGISLYLSGSKPGAERAFRHLLRLDPKARLDPSFVRPEVVTFFEQIRKRYGWEQKEVVRKRGPKGPAVANLIPPWGQFQNGHKTKAYLVLGGELGLGAASIVTAALLWSWQRDDKTFENGDTAEVLRPINWVTFAAAMAVVAYGIIDGLYYYYRTPTATRAPKLGHTDPMPTFSSIPTGITF